MSYYFYCYCFDLTFFLKNKKKTKIVETKTNNCFSKFEVISDKIASSTRCSKKSWLTVLGTLNAAALKVSKKKMGRVKRVVEGTLFVCYCEITGFVQIVRRFLASHRTE